MLLKFRRFIALAVAGCLIGSFMTGCGQNADGGSSAADSGGDSKKFAHISLEIGLSCCQAMIAGMNQVLREGDTLELYNYELDDNKFMEMMEQIVNMDYDGVIIYAKDGDLGTQAAEMCKEAGLPATAIDIALTDPSALVGYSFGSDYGLGYNSGLALAQGVYEKNGSYECNMLITCRNTDTVGSERLRGFMDAVAAHPEMNIVYNVEEEWTTDAMLAPIENTLAANPQIDAVWTTNAAVGAAAVQVLEEMGRIDDTVVVSIECSLWVKEQIEAGKIYAGIDAVPYEMGYTAMNMLYDYLDGKEFEKDQSLDSLIVTIDNLDDSNTWKEEAKITEAY